MKVVILTVNVNAWEATKRMLMSANSLDVYPDIYVLDNKSDVTPEFSFKPKEYYYKGNSFLFKLDKRFGYFGAVSAFLSLKKDMFFDWLFISNNDLIFNDHYLFNYLKECSEMWQGSIGVYCPRIISTRTGLNQNPYLEKKPTLYYAYKYKLIASSYYIAKLYATMTRIKAEIKKIPRAKEGEIQKKPRPIFAPHGSFIGFNNDFFSRGGYIESRNFLYFEEEILGFICDRIGVKVLYDPRVQVQHDQHLTTGNYNKWIHNIRSESLRVLEEYIKQGVL